MKSICIVSAVYPPEPQVTARMSFDLASHLSAMGNRVTVLCPQPSRPMNADYSRYRDSTAPVIVYEAMVKVVRLASFVSPLSRMYSRIRESCSFGWEVVKYLSTEHEVPDVLYVNSWPIFSQAIIARFARNSRVPMVLQIMDIYPEALISKLPLPLHYVLNAPLKKVDAWITRSASSVVVISENMRKIYTESRQINSDLVVTIPTWQDEKVFENILSRSECCAKYGIDGNKFTFLYLGNIGPVAGVDFLIRAFAEANIDGAQLLIVGDGADKAECVALVERLRLSGVYFVSDPESAHVPLMQNMAHVCMLPMKRGAGMSSIPSKLPSYLFSARAVIATVDSESDTANFVRQAKCGWVGEPENITWLADKMKEVFLLPADMIEIIGQRGKQFGLAHFSKSKGVVRLASKILQVAGGIYDS